MTRTPADLIPLMCSNCGSALEGEDESALFTCAACGLVHEPCEEGLASFPAVSARMTTGLAAPQQIRYLAVWRVRAPKWEYVNHIVPRGTGHLYVPAFSLTRPVMQKLGAALCMAQPNLEFDSGLPVTNSSRPVLVEAGREDPTAFLEGPGFGAVSPVVVGRRDLKALAEFVYLSVELGGQRELRELLPLGFDLGLADEELVFLPAVWDTRYIREAYWRFLLSEFDGQVA